MREEYDFFFCHFDFTTWPALCIFAISTCIYNRSVTLKSHNLQIRQGLSYRAQFCPVTVTKIWTQYSQTNFLPIHQKIPHFKSFPFMYDTLGPNKSEVG